MALKRTYCLLNILLCCIACLAGCSAKTYTPVLQTSFDLNALVKTGDFSYQARLVRDESGVSVTPLTTAAAGMKIACDGKSITLSQGAFSKSIEKGKLDATNPAAVLYEVFSYLESLEKVNSYFKDDCFIIRGKTSVGTFILVQTKNNKMKSVSVPDAKIEIEFIT